MFYRPGKDSHGLPYDPFKACVLPRPIGWISTLSPSGTPNLAPYSQFSNLSFDPPYIMFSANQTPTSAQKDTVRNVHATGVFCWNLATWELREEVNVTGEQVAYGVDEFERAGVDGVGSRIVGVDVEVDGDDDGDGDVGKSEGKKTKKKKRVPVPMIARSPIRFECEHYTTLRLPGNPPMGAADVVIGRVVGIHIDESVLTEGKIDVSKTQPIARCGYYEYAVVRETFEMTIPGEDPALLAGLEGSAEKVRAAEETGEREEEDRK